VTVPDLVFLVIITFALCCTHTMRSFVANFNAPHGVWFPIPRCCFWFSLPYPVEFDLNLSLWWYAEPELNEPMELVICEPEPRYLMKPFLVSNLISYLAIENQLAFGNVRRSPDWRQRIELDILNLWTSKLLFLCISTVLSFAMAMYLYLFRFIFIYFDLPDSKTE